MERTQEVKLEDILIESRADPRTGNLVDRYRGEVVYVCQRHQDGYWYGQFGNVIIKTMPHVARNQARNDLINNIRRWEKEQST